MTTRALWSSEKTTISQPLSQQENSEQFIILARLKAEELLRRAENEKIREKTKITKKTHPEAPAEPRSTAPACVRSGLSRFLQAKRASRASPPLLASRRSTATRCSRKSGKSPCRSTGKANIQIVVRLCRASASNQPPCKKRSALQNNQHRSSAEKTGAGQSDSDASTGSARCRLPPLAVNHT